MSEARKILSLAPVIPVLTIDDPDSAVPLAQALVRGGLPVLEVTLRTSAGLGAISAIAAAVPDAVVGAGTVLNPRQYEEALEAGSRFVVTPGLTPRLADAARESSVPLIPGIATVSEMMSALDRGWDCLKFFPAEAAGGAAVLRAFAGPFPEVAFCPTGGIGLGNIADYLALNSVLTVGGSWLTPASRMAAGDWEAIEQLAREACEAVSAIRSEG